MRVTSKDLLGLNDVGLVLNDGCTTAEAASETRRGQQPASVRRELLRLRMCIRMLAVPSAEEFDEDIYSEAGEAVVAAAAGVADVSGCVVVSWPCIPFQPDLLRLRCHVFICQGIGQRDQMHHGSCQH